MPKKKRDRGRGRRPQATTPDTAGPPASRAQEQQLFQSLRAALRSGEPADLLAIVSGFLEVTDPGNAKGLLAHFGITGSVSDRAGTLMRAAGMPTGYAVSSIELGDPGLLVAARRRRLIESRDSALAEG